MSPQAPKTLRVRRHKRQERRPNSHQRYGKYHRNRRESWLYEQFAAGNVRCALCGDILPQGKNAYGRSLIHLDHRIPPSSAGPIGSEAYNALRDDETNWQPACARCNSRKQNRG